MIPRIILKDPAGIQLLHFVVQHMHGIVLRNESLPWDFDKSRDPAFSSFTNFVSVKDNRATT